MFGGYVLAFYGNVRACGSGPDPLFTNRYRVRLEYHGLVSMLRRRAREANVMPAPTPHQFRRAFALAMLRGGADILSIQQLLGHSDLSV